jgi:hypothetical protein
VFYEGTGGRAGAEHRRHPDRFERGRRERSAVKRSFSLPRGSCRKGPAVWGAVGITPRKARVGAAFRGEKPRAALSELEYRYFVRRARPALP